jgi:8-oxo-dGTP diphosphatase
VESALREIKEETGLSVSDLVFCGIIYRYNGQTKDKDIVFNFKKRRPMFFE